MAAAGVPASSSSTGSSRASRAARVDLGQLTGTGDLGQTHPRRTQVRLAPVIEPFISNIVAGIHIAFSLAVAQTFWIGVGASIIAAIAAIGMKELPLRATRHRRQRPRRRPVAPRTRVRAVPAAD